MQESRKRVFHILALAMTSVLFATAGNTEQRSLSALSEDNTRGNDPVSEFRTHMLRAIGKFPISRQCAILTAIIKDSGESPSRVLNNLMIDTTPNQDLPCIPMTSPSRAPVNVSGLRDATDRYISSLFNDLPTAFQCKIASDVTFASRGDATKAALAETMAKISKELKTLDKTLSCTETHPREIITNTRVQIGVRLRKSLPLDAWLERFKRIMPTIYLSYISKTGRVSEFATGWRTNKKGVKIPIIPFDKFLVNFYDQPITDASVAMVSFSLFSRTESGDYRLINGDEVAASFDGLSRSVLNSYIQAEVIGWQAHREKGNNQRLERTRKRNSKPSLLQSYRLQTWFPKYLLNFFKSMSSNGRCYILRQISSYVEQDLLVVEKWYNWLGQLPKKYYCSRASKYVAKTKNKHPKPLRSIWDRLDKYIQMIQTISSVAPTLRLGTTISQARNSTVVRETRPFNSMEIVMFALLGFLCLLIMVFVGNCVVFTFKTKQLNNEYFSDFQSPQFVYDGAKDCDLVSADHAPEKLPVTENPQQATGGKDSDNHHHWRLLSLTSEGRATVCSDLLSLSEEESERVSSV